MTLTDVVFYLAAPTAIAAGWLVFRVDSMLRAAFLLLGSFIATGVVLLLLASEFLFVITVLMMTGEMTIMAVFMVMFMMNPGGLMPMQMVHLPRLSAVAGIIVLVTFSVVVLASDFPPRSTEAPADVQAALGQELLGPSMVIFETAGVALLTVMIGGIALASKRGRYGMAVDELETEGAPADAPTGGHGGHG